MTHSTTHLNVAERLFRDEVNGNREEIVCVSGDSELHRAGLV